MSEFITVKDFVKLESLNDLDSITVLELGTKSLLDIKPVYLIEDDISEVTRELYTFTFDDVKQNIIYEKDLPGSEKFNLKLPKIDEQSLSEYKNKNNLPPSGFFMKMIPSIKKMPMGLLEIKYRGFEIHINENNNIHLKDWKIFEEKVYFIFDFEKNIYERVHTKTLLQEKKRISRGAPIEKIKNERVKNYIQREELLKQIKGKIKVLTQRISEIFFKLRTKEQEMFDLIKVEEYLNSWREFYENLFENWLRTKMIYSIISEEEYHILRSEGERIYKFIIDGLSEIEEIKLLTKRTDTQSFMVSTKPYEKFREIEKNAFYSIRQSLEKRDGRKISGYFLCEKKGEYFLMESFYEIERRRLILDEIINTKVVEENKKFILNLIIRNRS